MTKDISSTREFVRGVAAGRDFIFIISKVLSLIDEGISHSSVIGLEYQKWVSVVDVNWDASAISIAWKPARKIVVVGEDGDVVTHVRQITEKEVIPGNVIAIRNAITIDGYVFACGMQRQAFRRIDDGKWIDMSAPSGHATESIGFEAIDGYSDKEIYAVGWGGEVWQYDGAEWHQHGSPTNVVLSAVLCAPDGVVYVAGQRGVMLRGRNSVWETIEWDHPVDVDLWSLCWFNDQLYVASAGGLFVLKGNMLMDVDLGEVGNASCFCLTTAEGVLWSIGHADVMSFDGKQWVLYP